jgi:hypothetical protein
VRRRRQSQNPVDPDAVSLVIEGVGPMSARVWRAAPGVADLEIPPGLPTGALDGREATMVVVTGKELEGRIEVGWRPGHVRFVREDVQRREHDRVEIVVPALLLPDQLTGMWRTETRDIGIGGVLLGDAGDVPLGARLDVLLDLPHEGAGASVRARGQVVRAPGAALRAVRFEELADGERARLQRAVTLEQVRRLGGD